MAKTKILADLTHYAPSMADVPVKGVLECTPSRRVTEGCERIALPVSIGAPIVGGLATLWLEETGPSWCWKIRERCLGGITRYVVVPHSDMPVPYACLTEVDPTTLAATAEALAGWTATLDEVRAVRDDVVAVLPLVEPIPGIATVVHADASTAASAAEEAAAQAAQAGQHRQAAEQAAQTAAADTTTAVEHLVTDAQTALTQTVTTAAQTITDQTDTSVAQVRAEIIDIDYDPTVGWIVTKGA